MSAPTYNMGGMAASHDASTQLLMATCASYQKWPNTHHYAETETKLLLLVSSSWLLALIMTALRLLLLLTETVSCLAWSMAALTNECHLCSACCLAARGNSRKCMRKCCQCAEAVGGCGGHVSTAGIDTECFNLQAGSVVDLAPAACTPPAQYI